MLEPARYICVGVCYDAFSSVPNWHASIIKQQPNARVILVDNFSNAQHRNKIAAYCTENGIELITLPNVGYGVALNRAIEYLSSYRDLGCEAQTVLVMGNIDVEFKYLPSTIPQKKVYIPDATDGVRILNPFLTRCQKKFLKFHDFAERLDSKLILIIGILVLKCTRFFPSKPWAVHGSIFALDLQLATGAVIFNSNTFLYSEELEFASWVEKNDFELDYSEISYEHTGGVSTFEYRRSFKKFFSVWKVSFKNWRNRWK